LRDLNTLHSLSKNPDRNLFMRYFSHYLPFFIITTALYAAVFYHHKEVTVIKPLPLNSGLQSVQVQFINDRQALPSGEGASKLKKDKSKPAEKSAASFVAKKEQKTATSETQEQQNQQLQTAFIAAHSKNNAEIKASTQKLQKTIRETTAKHDAQLKAELFAEQLKKNTRVTENRPKSPANKQPILAATSPKK